MAESLLSSRWAVAIDPARRDGRILKTRTEPAAAAETSPLPAGLEPAVGRALAAQGIESLYGHQTEVWNASREGSVIVTTATASGKSLAFNLPVLDSIARAPKARALYLYPTKALAQDQARSLARLGAPNLRPAIYDGDTPKDERPAVRRSSNLVLTNPDMLHVGILPHHRSWGDFLQNLEWVVIDEAHTYRGVFGSNVANVIRRLRRLARAYGAEPKFILASATIANPGELAGRLVGDEFALVDRDTAPRAKREINVWNPPLINPAIGARRSSLAEAADLLAELVTHDVRTICFLKSRRGIELIRKFAAENLERRGRPELAEKIAPYRAGYTRRSGAASRRTMVEGRLLGVVATNALELGIDIGELDAAICVTFPGTVAGLRQMWGRAGRRRPGLAVYIAGQDGLDQYFCRHPEEFLERPVEAAILDHQSPEIAAQHLVAAAYELPLTPEDSEWFGPDLPEATESLLRRGELRQAGGGLVPRKPGFVASSVSLRSSSAENVAVVDGSSGEVIGTVEFGRAFTTIHPGAVYMHFGNSYEVEQLDLAGAQAVVRPFDDEWYTRPKQETDIFIDKVLAKKTVAGVDLHFGEISVTDHVIAYQRVLTANQEAIDLVDLDLPEQEFRTKGLWYTVPEEMTPELPLNGLLGALHATEHSQIAVLPLIAMCDRWDIGGLSTNIHAQTGRPTIFIYDGHPGGIGIARRGYDCFDRLVGDAFGLVNECPCGEGCPSCVQSPKCGNLNEPLFKAGAIGLMEAMQGALRREAPAPPQ
ncbi:MAG: DEAD/DEAH box helicase [Solirubrobacterales bacterium]|nr:DEAD/DEAH box helicase [Solirubrobacterales bacterium]